jgi:uncharacterized membrane protein
VLDAGFMRTEVWHALSVHFPISLLLVSTLTMLVSFFMTGNYRRNWQHAATGLLLAGCITAWIATYTGNLADGIVARKLCDPTILKDHEIAAQTMTYLFSVAAVLSVLLSFKVIKARLEQLSIYLIFILMLTGSGYLIYAGHIGASLVYQQGAGVYNHAVDCDK